MCKRAYFPTLNDALRAEGLLDLWDGSYMTPIAYGETRAWFAEEFDRDEHGRITSQHSRIRRISIYRDGITGKYERPVHYLT